ncbi:MAG TPA: alpha/beta fold hydrolase [Acidimicrobiia bacterium]
MADPRVEAAIANWAPRFVAQGVDYNDFLSTTSRIERWEEWLDAWSETADRHFEQGAEAEAVSHRLTAGEAYVRAALCYHFAKFVWMLDAGKHRAAADRAVESLYAAHAMLDLSAQRLEIPFEAGLMVANLRRPQWVELPPLVLLIPGLDSTKEEFFNWENVFLSRGMATLSLDGPGQGETGYSTSIRPDYEVAVTAALEGLDARDDIDVDHVGAVGVSLGGYYVTRAAAFEPRLRAVTAIGGPFDLGSAWRGLPPLTKETFMIHSGSGDEREAHEKAASLSLEGVASSISQPLLVVFGKLDRLIPWEQAERLAAEAPDATLVMYEEGNHACNNIPYRYRPLVGDWMADQLKGAGSSP